MKFALGANFYILKPLDLFGRKFFAGRKTTFMGLVVGR
jgi:hypothetical protein